MIHTNAVCLTLKEINMNWTTPSAQDMRFGFEITMYIANR
jgi:coenzyme PQQ precursor peptide PqqA